MRGALPRAGAVRLVSRPSRAARSSHRAIELLLNWRGEPTPHDLVDDALGRLTGEDSSLGDWLATLAPGDQADVCGRAVARVTQFVESFPPLRRTWHPVTEAQIRWPLGGPITLRAKADIVIGRPAGRESRKVLIDLKSGGISNRHRDDLRYYALVETLVREVPPRMVASFSLEAGDAVVEMVTEGMLRSALRRTLDADQPDGRAAGRGAATGTDSQRRVLPVPRRCGGCRRAIGRQLMTWTWSPTARWSQIGDGVGRPHADAA